MKFSFKNILDRLEAVIISEIKNTDKEEREKVMSALKGAGRDDIHINLLPVDICARLIRIIKDIEKLEKLEKDEREALKLNLCNSIKIVSQRYDLAPPKCFDFK